MKIEWNKLTDQELVELAKSSVAALNKRIENKKLELISWGQKFRNKEDLVIAYMGESTFSSEELAKGLVPFFPGSMKDKAEQVADIVKKLIKKSRIVKDGDNYAVSR